MLRYTNYERKLLFHVDRVAAVFSGRIQAPVNVEIDLSNRCSLGCQDCHFAYTHTKGPLAVVDREDNLGDLMDYGLIRRIIQDLATSGVRSITWTGGGEPTLHPHFRSIIQMASVATIPQGLYTSGVHVDAHLAGKLAENMDWVYVSLDCADAKTYKKEKRVDRFEAATNAVRLMAKASVPVVGVGFLIHEKNWTRMLDMAVLAKDLGGSYVQFRPAIHFDPNEPDKPTSSRKWLRHMAEIVLPDIGIPVEFDRKRFKQLAEWEGHGYSQCLWSGLQTVISPNGCVWTCCNKRGFSNHCLGDLSKERFQDVWARRPIASVDKKCRVMCRGHMPNVVLHEIAKPIKHGNFI
jgi:MoaA/NifB/PqqE/SkfB family radical SAM enzyme